MKPPGAYRPERLVPPPARNDGQIEAAARAYFEAMKSRRSVRDFSDRPVPRAVIETLVATAGRAPSGANQQPWHFAAIGDADAKARVRSAAEEEERAFYAGGGGDEWIRALEPLGTGPEKPHLTTAPWLIVVFAQRVGLGVNGTRHKHYYVPESVGIACGFLIAAIHWAGLVTLPHTPNPMKFLNRMCDRPEVEKPVMILPVGHPADGATVPAAAGVKKPLSEILTVIG
jgi:nitroreductase